MNHDFVFEFEKLFSYLFMIPQDVQTKNHKYFWKKILIADNVLRKYQHEAASFTENKPY